MRVSLASDDPCLVPTLLHGRCDRAECSSHIHATGKGSANSLGKTDDIDAQVIRVAEILRPVLEPVRSVMPYLLRGPGEIGKDHALARLVVGTVFFAVCQSELREDPGARRESSVSVPTPGKKGGGLSTAVRSCCLDGSYAVVNDRCKLVGRGFSVDEFVDQHLAETSRNDLVPSTGLGRVQSVVGLFDKVFRGVL